MLILPGAMARPPRRELSRACQVGHIPTPNFTQEKWEDCSYNSSRESDLRHYRRSLSYPPNHRPRRAEMGADDSRVEPWPFRKTGGWTLQISEHWRPTGPF